MCSNEIPTCNSCTDLPNKLILLKIKPYVYEKVNGKRKRVSSFTVNELGQITEIKERAIISKH